MAQALKFWGSLHAVTSAHHADIGSGPDAANLPPCEEDVEEAVQEEVETVMIMSD